MDEQEKKYQDLFTELTNNERSGVRMQMNGLPASPLQSVSAHMVREESNNMRDYILDEQGMIRELDFIVKLFCNIHVICKIVSRALCI